MTVAENYRPLAEMVSAEGVLVLTGAGVSTDSGIPDYRGPDGVQRVAAPMTYDRFTGSVEQRRRYWARSHLGWERVATARPNAGHAGVVRLQDQGLVSGVVTQNVDGLHTAAGTRDVVDLHGRLDAVVCLGCGDRRSRLEVALRLDAVNPGWRDAAIAGELRPDGDLDLPDRLIEDFRIVDCRRCGGVLKPDVVFFGEAVPRDRFRRALGLVETSASLLVLGSSLAVGSGYRIVTAAAHRGIPIGIVNRGATRGDHHATFKLDAGVSDVVTAVAQVVTPV